MIGNQAARILVVEDDPSLADAVTTGLMDEGFTVSHTADGDDAWQALESSEWGLVILDWWLPGQDGLSILQRYRNGGGGTPVLFLTARDAVSDRVCGLNAGADDYLCKPFAFEELLARVRALIRRHQEPGNMVLAYCDIRVDLILQRAERAGRSLDLTSKELSLLSFFMNHPDEILSRTRIYGQVWGEDYDFISNTLDVHIKELRRKLELSGPRLIHTLRGRGYILSEPPVLLPGDKP